MGEIRQPCGKSRARLEAPWQPSPTLKVPNLISAMASSSSSQSQPNFPEMMKRLQQYQLLPEEQAIAKRATRQLTYSAALGLSGGIATAYLLSKKRGFTGARKIGAYVAFTVFGAYTGTTVGLSFAVPTLKQLETMPIWKVIMDALETPAGAGANAGQLPGAVRPMGSGSGAAGSSDFGSVRPNGMPTTARQLPSSVQFPGQVTGQGQQMTGSDGGQPPQKPVKYNKWGDKVED